MPQTAKELRTLLLSLDRKGYPAYKSLAGNYQFDSFTLSIDHVQGDPFASPSKLSAFVPMKCAGFPSSYRDDPWKKTALEDYLLRLFGKQISRFQFQAKGSGKSGLLSVSRPGQEILERSAVAVSEKGITVRFEVGFPANGRTIYARELEKILFDFLPVCISAAFYYSSFSSNNKQELKETIELAIDQHYIRTQLASLGLCAFIADGSILPRESGVSDRPMKKSVPFSAPDSLAVTLNLPCRGKIRGLGIKKGITLIAGGGYHGKSTLLKALERGVYNHIKGDGRELIITDDTALKLRAEDGRKISGVDISLFINDLPNGKDTHSFSTLDASGSTSQAANIVEGLEAGSRLLLIDEDTSATNFMIRDEFMQHVISQEKEPITPFLERVSDLYQKSGISTVLVVGSCGSYFHAADTILQMDCYRPVDITEKVKELCKSYPLPSLHAPGYCLPNADRRFGFCMEKSFAQKSADKLQENPVSSGRPNTFGNSERGRGRQGRSESAKIKLLGSFSFSLDKETLDLRYVEQLVDPEQTAALAFLLRYAKENPSCRQLKTTDLVNFLEEKIKKEGITSVCNSSYVPGNLALPRRQEIFACFNRW